MTTSDTYQTTAIEPWRTDTEEYAAWQLDAHAMTRTIEDDDMQCNVSMQCNVCYVLCVTKLMMKKNKNLPETHSKKTKINNKTLQ